jgi:hypothetical protein
VVDTIVGVFVGDAVLITMGATVVGLAVTTMGVFVGVSVGGGGGCTGDGVVRIGFRVGVKEGGSVVGVLVLVTGAGVTLISGSSMAKNAGMTIPPLYSMGTT